MHLRYTLPTFAFRPCMQWADQDEKNLFTSSGKAQLSTDNTSIVFIPGIITYCPPLSLIAKFYLSTDVVIAPHQSDITIHTVTHNYNVK